MDPIKLFETDDSTRTKNNGAKLKSRSLHSDCTKFFFTNAVVRDRNRLPPSVKIKLKLGAYAEAVLGLGAHLHDIGP